MAKTAALPKKHLGILNRMQRLGQALMIPVSVLPAAGLVVALGRALQSISPDSSWSFLIVVGKLFYSGGLAVFEQLPVIFAAGVAIGFSGGAGVAVLAAVAGYFTLGSLLKVLSDVRELPLAINTGVFGGILIGFLAAHVYKRYHQTRLNPIFGFFSGKRLVPILTVFYTLFVGLILGLVWPPIQNQISEFGMFVMQSDYGAAFYAAGKRLLIPVGLHHVYYPSFLFQFGEFVTAAGEVVRGDSARYFAGDHTAGIFMASEFPIMLFGLPAAALAMVMRARKENRAAIAGIMLSAGLTSIVTGITEPIEFAFIFVAPLLFLVHVGLAFVSGVLTTLFSVHLGYTFSASLIDFVLGFFNQQNAWALWLIIGPIMAVLYFGTFYTLIGVFNFKTPGREDETLADAEDLLPTSPVSDRAREILVALGGAANIVSLSACITRLRVQVKNMAAVKRPAFKELGAAGHMVLGPESLQIVFGVESDQLREEIQTLMDQPEPTKTKLTDEIPFTSPLKGKILPLTEAPDAVFASGTVGEGFAIQPFEGIVYAPFDGEVLQIFKTNHAIGILSNEGLETLIHIGIDTVKMGGKGFKSMLKVGDRFKAGDRLLEFDLDLVQREAKSAITPVIFTNKKLKDLAWAKENGLVDAATSPTEVVFQ